MKQISFGAIYLQNVEIKKYFFNKSASIVEIEQDNKDDFFAVKNAVTKWENDTYGKKICENLYNGFTYEEKLKNSRIFALTTQKKDFKNLKDSKILGLFQICNLKEKDGCFLDYLQVKPNTNYNNKYRKYKNIGSAIIEYLKSQYNKIVLDADEDAIEFYEKLGFIKTKNEKNINYMTWVSNKNKIN